MNSAFVNNSGGVRFSGTSENTAVSNTVFANNSDFDVIIEEATIPNIVNSYISSMSGIAFTKNILTTGELGFINITDNNFGLTQISVLIDSGKNLDNLIVPDQTTGLMPSFPVSDIVLPPMQ